VLGVAAAEPTSDGEAYGYEGGDADVYVAGFVVGPDGEDSDGE
jgi:hypothetical protein